MRAQRNHRLNRKAVAWLRSTNRLVLGIVRDVGRTMEKTVNAMTTISSDDTAVLCLCMCLYDISKVSEKYSRLNELDGLIQTFSGSLDNANTLRISLSFISNVVSLVDITVVTAVVQCDVNIEDISVDEFALIGNAVTDDLVD